MSRLKYDFGNRKRKDAWLRRKTNMIISNRILCVGDIFHRFPGALRYVVPDPVHQILEFAAPESGIEDRMNLELR